MGPQGAAVSREEKKVENKEVRILVVDDEPIMADSLRQNFIEEGYSVDTAATGAAAIELFDQGGHHLAICDLQLPDVDGMEVLRHMKDAKPTTEVIVVTGYGSVQKAVEATKAGAFYFVEKPFDFEELQPLVEKALERRELVAETANMRRQLSTRAEYFNIIGSSKPMQQIYETIESVAKSDANVLIVGESGTGKELIANAIHYNSLRAKKPFIKVNCAALPKELIESELFGHTKGAFTGAHADKDGLIQHAEQGSLLLDEIAEMPVELQPKLLRVLQERSEDIQLLAEHFLKMYARKYQRSITGISQSAYQRLFSHTWPGNVRELQNVLERAVLLAKNNKIEPVDLPFDNGSLPDKAAAGAGWDVPPNMALEEIEKFVIERTLQRTGGNKQAAANLLGIYRPRLYSKIKKYKIDIPALTAS